MHTCAKAFDVGAIIDVGRGAAREQQRTAADVELSVIEEDPSVVVEIPVDANLPGALLAAEGAVQRGGVERRRDDGRISLEGQRLVGQVEDVVACGKLPSTQPPPLLHTTGFLTFTRWKTPSL